jgi:hypothetical protein
MDFFYLTPIIIVPFSREAKFVNILDAKTMQKDGLYPPKNIILKKNFYFTPLKIVTEPILRN